MIEASNLRVSFRTGGLRRPTIDALDRFNLVVEAGDVFALLGPNGAGKSTAMYCFLGLIKPNEGEVRVLGQPPEPGDRLYQRIAYLPEEPHYHLYLTVEEAVAYYGNLYFGGVEKRRVGEVLELVDLGRHRRLKLSKCSKGMRQKAGIAACLLRKVDLLFLDEPTRGLDPVMVRSLRNILRDLNANGTTIVVNSHVLSEIEMLCNRVAIMNDGRVLVQKPLNELLETDLDSYVVEMDAPAELPTFMSDVERGATTVHGRLPTKNLPDLFRLADEQGLRILSCAHRRLSLEEAFTSVLEDRR
jgi:ABC-2 type transport system ATP-binding protein